MLMLLALADDPSVRVSWGKLPIASSASAYVCLCVASNPTPHRCRGGRTGHTPSARIRGHDQRRSRKDEIYFGELAPWPGSCGVSRPGPIFTALRWTAATVIAG